MMSEQSLKVFEAFKKHGPTTDRHISQITGLSVYAISARRNDNKERFKMNFGKDPVTGRKACLWEVNN